MKIKKEDVQYLVFEGGGGKGVTYLGALQALKDLNILTYEVKKLNTYQVTRLKTEQIKGVAGTSVGSLTALLVACGYSPREIWDIITSEIGSNILDTVKFGKMPTIYTKEHPQYTFTDTSVLKEKSSINRTFKDFLKVEKDFMKDMMKMPSRVIRNFNYHFFALLFKWYLYFPSLRKETEKEKQQEDYELIPSLKDLAKDKTLKPAVDNILEHPSDAMNSLKYEYGLFLAKYLREAVDELIEKKSGIKNCTFKEFYEHFGIDLVIAAFDVVNNEVVFFRNNEQWKDLCVADAVRMSTSIPIIFKPVLMKKENGQIKTVVQNEKDAYYFVDGGLGNNLPLHVFDDGDEMNPKVLAFTLSQFKPFSHGRKTLFGYLENIFIAVINQTTNLQIRTSEERDQVIGLDADKISVLDFTFEEFPEAVIEDAKKRTLEYFNEN